MSVVHTFYNAVPDDNTPTGAVGPDEWNATHSISGTSGEVLFNDLGDAGQDPALTFDKATGKLTIHKFASTGTPGDYTLAKSGYVVSNAAGAEVFRLWATDPDLAGDYNSANLYLGRLAGNAQPTDNVSAGYANLGIGDSALASITTGYNNVAVGLRALTANTEGRNNLAIGSDSMAKITTGHDNVTVGVLALHENLTGFQNVAIGDAALYSGLSDDNVGIGDAALYYSTTGTENVGIGGLDFDLPDDNRSVVDTRMVFIGMFATRGGRANTVLMTNGIAIGYRAVVTNDNTAVIGNASLTDAYFGSDAGLAKLHASTLLATGLSASQVVVTDGSKNLVSGGALYVSPLTTGGDLLYGGAAGVATRLANGTAGQVLTSSGTTVAPVWATPSASPSFTAFV